MGWCSGTEIFDVVAHNLFVKKNKFTKQQRFVIMKTLINVMEDHDWDCHGDSEYYAHPEVREVIENLHPGWFAEEEDDE